MELIALNLPTFDYKLQKKNDKIYIFDIIRKKYILLTPEEWVRQHIIHYLITYRGYPPSLIAVEKSVKINNLDKRIDCCIFNNKGEPIMIIECKAPYVELSKKVFEQIFDYNIQNKISYLLLTNGTNHIVCKINKSNKKIEYFLNEIPIYKTLINMQD